MEVKHDGIGKRQYRARLSTKVDSYFKTKKIPPVKNCTLDKLLYEISERQQEETKENKDYIWIYNVCFHRVVLNAYTHYSETGELYKYRDIISHLKSLLYTNTTPKDETLLCQLFNLIDFLSCDIQLRSCLVRRLTAIATPKTLKCIQEHNESIDNNIFLFALNSEEYEDEILDDVFRIYPIAKVIIKTDDDYMLEEKSSASFHHFRILGMKNDLQYQKFMENFSKNRYFPSLCAAIIRSDYGGNNKNKILKLEKLFDNCEK